MTHLPPRQQALGLAGWLPPSSRAVSEPSPLPAPPRSMAGSRSRPGRRPPGCLAWSGRCCTSSWASPPGWSGGNTAFAAPLPHCGCTSPNWSPTRCGPGFSSPGTGCAVPRRDRRTVAAHRRHPPGVLALAQAGGAPARAVSRLGELRHRFDLFTVAAQSGSTRLMDARCPA